MVKVAGRRVKGEGSRGGAQGARADRRDAIHRVSRSCTLRTNLVPLRRGDIASAWERSDRASNRGDVAAGRFAGSGLQDAGATPRAPWPLSSVLCRLPSALCPPSSDVAASLLAFRPFGLIQKDQKIMAAAKPAAPALRERIELNSAHRIMWLLYGGPGGGGPQTVIRSFRSLRSGAETPVSREARKE
jgi:hypothetical protein